MSKTIYDYVEEVEDAQSDAYRNMSLLSLTYNDPVKRRELNFRVVSNLKKIDGLDSLDLDTIIKIANIVEDDNAHLAASTLIREYALNR